MSLFVKFHKKISTVSILFFMGMIVLNSCTSLPQNSPRIIKKYAFGQGGGFTGEYVEFSFAEDGKVYKRDFNNQRDVFYKQLNTSDLNYFIDKISELGIPTLEVNYPGNLTKYIEIREGETTLNKIVWGSFNYNAPQNIQDLHKEIYKKLAEFQQN